MELVLPEHQKLQEADKDDLNLLQKIEQEPLHEWWHDEDPENDFLEQQPDGSLAWVAKINFQFTQWTLRAGENFIPTTLYEYLKERKNTRRLTNQRMKAMRKTADF